MKRFAFFLVAALALAAPAPATAQGLGEVERLGDAVAINTRDGSSIFRLAFHIARTSKDVVDDTNMAIAFASCAECQTVAISIQVVLATGDPSVVTPENTALALNVECTLCDTLATAYQFVLGVETGVHFTPEGYRELAEIRLALQRLRDAGLSGPEIQAEVDALMDRLAGVLQNELVAGPPDQPSGTPTGTPAESGAPSTDASIPAGESPVPIESGSPTSSDAVSPAP